MDRDLTAFAEMRAQDLRLRYSRYLAPRRLLARVLEVEHRALNTLAKANKPVSCFGVAFAGYQDASCAVCQLQTACLTRTTAETLPSHEAKVGPEPVALAADMDIPLLAVALMQGLRRTLLENDTGEYVDEAQLKHGIGRRPVADVSAHRNPPKRPAPISVAAALLGAQAAETGWPPPPEPISNRLGVTLKDTFVIQALAYVPQRLTYGSPTWKKRVARDRRRLRQLNWLPEGTILRRIKKGERIEVRVYRDRLEWRDQTFATLYEVTAAICGRIEYRMPPKHPKGTHGTRHMVKVSAKRFFEVCFTQLDQRAAALQHMQKHHPETRYPLPQPVFTTCPECGELLAQVRGKNHAL